MKKYPIKCAITENIVSCFNLMHYQSIQIFKPLRNEDLSTLGVSSARIMCTLTSVLNQEGGKYGLAANCNGGGGASSIITI